MSKTNGVHICDGLYFRADSMQYMLIVKGEREKIDLKTKKGTGEMTEYETIVGYYGTIDACIKGARNYVIRKKIASGEIGDMDELIAEMRRWSETVAELSERLS